VKAAHRLDYSRFGEALVERGLVDREVLNHVLHQCSKTRGLLPEILVKENLVSDWELSRVVCEIYHLPFLTVDQCPPSPAVLDGYDLAYLRHFALVPLDRYGSLVSVIMPGLVSSEVLEGLRGGQGGWVLPIVGSVVSNRRWLEEHYAARFKPAVATDAVRPVLPERPVAPAMEELRLVTECDDGWGNIFDAGDEAVHLDLQGKSRRRP
jgi:hypothetical protein